MESLPATAAANRFGKYSLVARLATGGMAEIFLARLQGAAGFEKLVCIQADPAAVAVPVITICANRAHVVIGCRPDALNERRYRSRGIVSHCVPWTLRGDGLPGGLEQIRELTVSGEMLWLVSVRRAAGAG